MCGRYVSPDDAAIERHFRIDGRSQHPLSRRFNVAPTTTVPMLQMEDGTLTFHAARWGLVPFWWKAKLSPGVNVQCAQRGSGLEADVAPCLPHQSMPDAGRGLV